jgi:hypothetical protein
MRLVTTTALGPAGRLATLITFTAWFPLATLVNTVRPQAKVRQLDHKLMRTVRDAVSSEAIDRLQGEARNLATPPLRRRLKRRKLALLANPYLDGTRLSGMFVGFVLLVALSKRGRWVHCVQKVRTERHGAVYEWHARKPPRRVGQTPWMPAMLGPNTDHKRLKCGMQPTHRSRLLVIVLGRDPAMTAQVTEFWRRQGSVVVPVHDQGGCLRVATAARPDIIVLGSGVSGRLLGLLRAHPVSSRARIQLIPERTASVTLRAA